MWMNKVKQTTVRPCIGCSLFLGCFVALAIEPGQENTVRIPAPTLEAKPLFAPVERPMPGSEQSGTYQMRCWQRGQLLFTENNLSDPVVSALQKQVLSFNEKSVGAVHLVEVADTLCLIKRRKSVR